MATRDPKEILQAYLQRGREALLWKLDGASEYDIRRPLTPTATNLLGLVKHVASTESEYLGLCFGRPSGESLPWMSEDSEANSDMWATADETREDITGLYRRVIAHSDETIEALDLDATGEVPWWPPERRSVTLQQILVHMIAETHRHAGHADIVRELADGEVGLLERVSNLPDEDATWWADYRDRVEAAAARHRTTPS